jgi:hypothetical protein
MGAMPGRTSYSRQIRLDRNVWQHLIALAEARAVSVDRIVKDCVLFRLSAASAAERNRIRDTLRR